ncbi:MAG: hypothetical protein ACXWQO_11505 [Bdellovibrionota bacterium]
MKNFFIAAALLLSTSAVAATGAEQTAKVKINTYLLAVGLAGSFPNVPAPEGKELCALTKDALAGLGMLHGKSDEAVAKLLSFPGISAEQIPSVVSILSETEAGCVSAQ